MTAFYNEIDPYAARWLRNLIAAGHIAPGVVDERDIRDILPSELASYTQCHFFAGIGVWSYALRLAGWPDERPVWTGSCPCQPFSAAGKGAGFDDERHLWPAWHHLIKERRPVVVFGEQVANGDGLVWLDLVHADMEAEKYAFGAVDLCAAGIGAPHLRQRLFFMADADGRHARTEGLQRGRKHGQQPQNGGSGLLGNAGNARLSQRIGVGGISRRSSGADAGQTTERTSVHAGELEHAGSIGREWGQEAAPGHIDDGQAPERTKDQHGPSVAGAPWLHEDGAGPTNSRWRAADWLFCTDAKWRPVEPGTFPLAHGAPDRMGRLRAYGNAINAEAARAFIESVS